MIVTLKKTIVINSQEDMKKYYNERTNTYEFDDDVTFTCDIDVKSDIRAFDIYAQNTIKVENIYANNIKANDVYAHNIHAHNIVANDVYTHDIYTYDIIANDITSQDVKVHNIKAHNIDVHNVLANDVDVDVMNANDLAVFTLKAKKISAWNIIATNICCNGNIYYHASCIAYNTFKCKNINGRHENAIHKCLENNIEFIGDEDDKED